MIQSVYCRHWNPEVHDGSDRMYYMDSSLWEYPKCLCQHCIALGDAEGEGEKDWAVEVRRLTQKFARMDEVRSR